MGLPLIFWTHVFQTSSQEVLHTEFITDETKEVFSHKKRNSNIMCMGDTILATAADVGIDENWCLLENQ